MMLSFLCDLKSVYPQTVSTALLPDQASGYTKQNVTRSQDLR